MQRLKKVLFFLIEDTTFWPAKIFNFAMIFLIIVSMTVWLLDSNKEISASWGWLFQKIEYGCMLAFMAEYILRLLAYEGAAWKFPFKPMSLVDALAILPFFITGSSDTAALRVLRIFRVFRLFKLARYSEALNRLMRVFRENAGTLGIFLFVVVVILFIAAALMHALEPVRFAQMTDALWWAIVTLTTIGYGDFVPESLAGRGVAAIIMILGIGIIALPTGILGASLTKMMADEKKTGNMKCSRCGEVKHLAEARYCWRCGERLPEN